MATARTIVEGALKELRVTGAYNAVDAKDVKDGLEKLNDIMHALANDGTTYTHTTMTLTTTFPFAAKLEEPAKMWLARELEGLFGKSLSRNQMIRANEGEEAIFAAYYTVPAATFDTALELLPSNSYWTYTSE